MYKIEKLGNENFTYVELSDNEIEGLKISYAQKAEKDTPDYKKGVSVFFQENIPQIASKYWKVESGSIVAMTGEEQVQKDIALENETYKGKNYYIIIYDEKELFKQAFTAATILKQEVLAQSNAVEKNGKPITYYETRVFFINEELGQTRTEWHIWIDFIDVPEASPLWDLTTINEFGETVTLIQKYPNPIKNLRK